MIYKSNDTKFDEMAEKLGQLGNRKYHRKDSAVRAAKSSITPDIESVSVADDEPVYDLPPDLEIKVTFMMAYTNDTGNIEFTNCIYEQ